MLVKVKTGKVRKMKDNLGQKRRVGVRPLQYKYK